MIRSRFCRNPCTGWRKKSCRSASDTSVDRRGSGQCRRHQLADDDALAAGGLRAGERGPVEGEGPVAAQPPGHEVVLVEGLERVLGEHVLAHRRGGGAVEGVEQLAERHGGRSLGPVVLAAPV